MKQAHNSSSVPKIRCDTTRSIFLLFNIQSYFLHAYPQFPSFLPLSILATIFSVSVTKLNVRLSLHFVAFVFFYNTITVTMGHSLFHPCCCLVLSQFSDRFLRFTLQNTLVVHKETELVK